MSGKNAPQNVPDPSRLLLWAAVAFIALVVACLVIREVAA